MQSKSFLIAIAAFALTATGTQAYGGSKMLTRAGLTPEQVQAIEQARELRESGDNDAARDKLLSAGVDEGALQSMRVSASQTRSAIHAAIESEDYEAFREAVADAPLADIITTEADFEQLVAAHSMRHMGDIIGSDELLDELGVEPKAFGHGQVRTPKREFLSDEQRQALQVAQQANDRTTMQAIFDEAGIDIDVR